MSFPALTGYYKWLFLYLEPISTMLPSIMTWVIPGAQDFHDKMIPGAAPSVSLDPRTTMVVKQLGNTYLLVSLITSLVYRVVRDALPNNAVAQDRILGSVFIALAIADVTHIAVTILNFPSELQFNPAAWNTMAHGNITFVVLLFVSRVAWLSGIGRKAYYYGAVKRA